MRASWALGLSGWDWLPRTPWTSWGIWSATTWGHTHISQIFHHVKKSNVVLNSRASNHWPLVSFSEWVRWIPIKQRRWRTEAEFTLQLWTSCCWAAWFLLDEAAFWAAAMVWVAAAAACLAAFCQKTQTSALNIELIYDPWNHKTRSLFSGISGRPLTQQKKRFSFIRMRRLYFNILLYYCPRILSDQRTRYKWKRFLKHLKIFLCLTVLVCRILFLEGLLHSYFFPFIHSFAFAPKMVKTSSSFW